MLDAGRYQAKVEDYGVRVSKKGDPLVVIVFNVAGELIYWNGNFTNDMGREIALKTLAECGLKDIKALTNGTFAEGKKTGCLDTAKDITVVVDITNGDNGKQFNSIKYVGGSDSIKDHVDKAKAASLFTGLGLEVDYEKHKPKMQIPF